MRSKVFLDRDGYYVSDAVFKAPGVSYPIRRLSGLRVVSAPVPASLLVLFVLLGGVGLGAAGMRQWWLAGASLPMLGWLSMRVLGRGQHLRLYVGDWMRVDVPVDDPVLLEDLVRSLGMVIAAAQGQSGPGEDGHAVLGSGQ